MSQVSQCNSDTHFLGLGEDYITYIYIYIILHYLHMYIYIYIYIALLIGLEELHNANDDGHAQHKRD